MKMKKKLLSVFLAFALAAGTVSALPADLAGTAVSVSAANTTSDGFEYQLVNDGKDVEITGYTGSAESVTVPAKIDGKAVTNVSSYTFYYNQNVKSITFADGLTKLDSFCILYCRNLTTVSIPASLESFGSTLFCGANSAVTVKVNSKNQHFTVSKNCLYSKDKSVLYYVPFGLTSFTVPSTVRKISDYAFSNNDVKTVKLNEGLETIGSCAFESSGITSITFPSTLKDIGTYAFEYCASLATVKFNSGLQSIGDYCFYSCTSLKAISLPDTLVSVGDYAFYNCSLVKSVAIPASVNSIGDYAFGYYVDYSSSYYGTIGIIPDFVIKCYYSTKGLSYAVSNDIDYTVIDPESITEMLKDFDNGTAVDLDLLSIDHYWSTSKKGLYYITNSNGAELFFQSFKNGKTSKVRDFKSDSCTLDLVSKLRNNYKIDSSIYIRESGNASVFSSYCQGNKLYIGCKYSYYSDQNSYSVYVLYVYDIDAGKLLKTYYIGDSPSDGYSYNALGADSNGRVFLARSQSEKENVTDPDTGETTEKTVTKYYVDMHNSSMKRIASAESIGNVYYFGDFDTASGVFSMCVYYNWRYWGYDHAMHAAALGKAGSNSLELKKALVCTIGQTYYSTIDHAMRNVSRYICVDSPLSVTGNLFNPATSGMSVYDISALYEDKEDSFKFNLNRVYCRDSGYAYHNGSKYARVCAVPGGESDHIIAVEGSTKVAEYDPEAGENKEIGNITTDHPVYELFSDNDYLYIIMIDSENIHKFYFQRIKWTYPTKITFSKSKLSVKVSNRKQLSASTDGTIDQVFEWSSSDPTVVSVSSSGVITAMKAGKAVITVKTKTGLKASCTVTVTDSALADVCGGLVKTSSSQSSNNENGNDYNGIWSTTVRSYIHENSDKTITRAEYYNNKIYIENYAADGKTPLSKTTILPELPIFGGIFFGKTYNFIVYGQQNTDQSDKVEVVRVVKYSKSWEKLGSASVKGANTYIPFDAGSLRMDEAGGRLYIHTCHEMYDDGDGVHHQANMTFTVKESSMKVEQKQYEVYNYTTGYVSHSFNQFVRVDGDRVYRLDHGDANPRGLYLNYFMAGSDPSNIAGRSIASFGSYGSYYNFTGANVGGFEVMSHNAVAAYSSLDQSDLNNSNQYNICLVIQDKDLDRSSNTIRLTDYKENSNVTVGTPQLVKINKEILLVMWLETRDGKSVTKLATVNEDGLLTSDIIALNADISDCQPVYCSDGLVRWYVTNYSAPVFYAVNPFYLSEYGSRMPGDVNGDGAVNMKDVTDLQRSINGWDVAINEKNSDLNGDGEINMKDITALQRQINN